MRRIGAHESGTRRREGFEVEAEGWLSNVALQFVQRVANCTGNRWDEGGKVKDEIKVDMRAGCASALSARYRKINHA